MIIFLGSCNTSTGNQNFFLLKYSTELDTPTKYPIHFYDLDKNILIQKRQSSFWSKDLFESGFIISNQNKKIRILIKDIVDEFGSNFILKDINGNYYEFTDFTSLSLKEELIFYKLESPVKLENLVSYLDSIQNPKKREIMKLKSKTNYLLLNNVIHQKDTFFLSKKDSYYIRKAINLKSNNLKSLEEDFSEFKYKVEYEYFIDYNEGKIDNIVSNNLKIFYYKLNDSIYCFELNKPLVLFK